MSKMDDFNDFLRKYFNEIKQQSNVIQPQLGLHGSWSLPTQSNEFKFDTVDKYTIDKINDLIVQHKLKCEKSDYVLNGETYIVENWISQDGQIVIQKVYKKVSKTKKVESLEELKLALDKAIEEERYEDASKLRDKISKFGNM